MARGGGKEDEDGRPDRTVRGEESGRGGRQTWSPIVRDHTQKGDRDPLLWARTRHWGPGHREETTTTLYTLNSKLWNLPQTSVV